MAQSRRLVLLEIEILEDNPKAVAELSADYLLGHLFYEKINFAMDFSLNFSLILSDLDNVDVGVNLGVRDAVFAMEDGLQNQFKFIISIGVINND